MKSLSRDAFVCISSHKWTLYIHISGHVFYNKSRLNFFFVLKLKGIILVHEDIYDLWV